MCLGRDAGWVDGTAVWRGTSGGGTQGARGPDIGFLRHIAADSVMLRPVDLHNCEGFAVYTPEQRRIGRVSHLIYGSDVDTPENRAAYKAAQNYERETYRIDEKRRKEQERLENLISHHVADDYAA